MKITTAILTIFISFLAFKPGIDEVCSILIEKEISCCNKKCTLALDNATDTTPKKNKDCNGKTCNPFQVCSSCVLLVNEVASIGDLCKPKPFFKLGFSIQSAISSQYISDFWQPPKFV